MNSNTLNHWQPGRIKHCLLPNDQAEKILKQWDMGLDEEVGKVLDVEGGTVHSLSQREWPYPTDVECPL